MRLDSVLSFFAGAIIGAAAVAVYISSDSSEDLRKTINNAREKAVKKFENLREDVTETASSVVDNVAEAVHTAADAVSAAADTIKG